MLQSNGTWDLDEQSLEVRYRVVIRLRSVKSIEDGDGFPELWWLLIHLLWI